jgi:hypothetical protein
VLLLANLPAIERDLAEGSVVVLEPDRICIRLLRGAMQKKPDDVLETWLRDMKIEAERRAS